MNQIDQLIANGVLGVDTLWGGDVMCPSGTGRFIADSWFSDEPLPIAYTTPTAAALREAGAWLVALADDDPRNRVALPDFRHRTAASTVTLGRAS